MKLSEFTWNSPEGASLFARAWVPEGKPKAVVCLVHGLGEHSGRYQTVGQALTGAGYAVIAFDLRGHGKSAGPRGHVANYEVVFEDIDHLVGEAAARFPEQPRFLYGHSLGGNLVLNYALRRQPKIAGIVATSPVLRPAFPVPAWKTGIGKVLYRFLPAFTLASGLNRADLSRDPAIIKAYGDDPLVHDRVSVRLGTDFLESGEWALAHAGDFRLPLLLVQGSQDKIVSPEASREFAEKVPGDCTFKMWEGLFHETHNEPEKEEVLAFMIAWLDRHAGETDEPVSSGKELRSREESGLDPFPTRD